MHLGLLRIQCLQRVTKAISDHLIGKYINVPWTEEEVNEKHG